MMLQLGNYQPEEESIAIFSGYHFVFCQISLLFMLSTRFAQKIATLYSKSSTTVGVHAVALRGYAGHSFSSNTINISVEMWSCARSHDLGAVVNETILIPTLQLMMGAVLEDQPFALSSLSSVHPFK